MCLQLSKLTGSGSPEGGTGQSPPRCHLKWVLLLRFSPRLVPIDAGTSWAAKLRLRVPRCPSVSASFTGCKPQARSRIRSKMAKKRNPHCVVPGCQTKQPHLDNGTVQALHRQFSDPVSLIEWTKSCIVEIIQSVIDDVNCKRYFAYLTRWRQPEELYCRALYVLFVASADEIPHVISCEAPNGFSDMWKKVNQVVFEGRGTLVKTLYGSTGEEFTVMNTLNNNAHGSYQTMLTCYSIVRLNTFEISSINKHLSHWKRLCDYLHHMEGLFKAGREKSVVLGAIRNMHKPLSEWQKQPAPTAK